MNFSRKSVVSPRLALCLIVTASIAVLLTGASGATVTGWKVFKNRAGWSVEYPANWKISSCQSCPDPSAPNVFVNFFPQGGGDDGMVMISRLQDRPTDISLDAWFAEIETSANLNAKISDQKFTLNGVPAKRVRYRNDAAGGIEMEEVYVLSGKRTFSILFDSDTAGKPLESLNTYPIYKRIVESFRVGTR